MRRPAPTLQLSPKVLKHFAAVTVIVTVLLGVLSANAQGELATPDGASFDQPEPAKANGLATELRLAKPGNKGSWGSDGDDVGSGSIVGSDSYTSSQTGSISPTGGNSVNFVPPPQIPLQPGATITISGKTRAELPGATSSTDPKKRVAGELYMPGEEEKQAIAAASRARTNAGGDSSPAD